MPFREHAVFQAPAPTAKVWRYLDLAKYLSVLDRSALFFARLDRLEDQFEGALSAPSIDRSGRRSGVLGRGVLGEMRLGRPAYDRSDYERVRRSYAVNCWYLSEYESLAMWRLYAAAGAGVAICTTFERLAASFVGAESVFIGAANYIDYDADLMPDEDNLLHSVVHKRKSFEHERELRCMTAHFAPFPASGPPPGTLPVDREISGAGIEVRVGLAHLIESVYVAPQRAAWERDLIDKLTRDTYGIAVPVKHSVLDRDPIN